jgi:pimeloyl-ACP methyl ester carboxylesterase
MNLPDGATLTTTQSRDGTEIGYWTTGEGPPLLLVHGGFGDHTRWDALRPHLEPEVTVHAMDRRGRGASGDHPQYGFEREFEDVAAVIDDVARRSGSPVDVYGVSLGGMCAIGGTGLTDHVRRLALYEGWPPPPPETSPPDAFIERAERMLAEGDREGVLEAGYRELLELGDAEIEDLRSRPEWQARLASVHTLPRELRAAADAEQYRGRLAEVDVPTLLLEGEEGPDWQAKGAAAIMPDARVSRLEGQSHMADLFAPALVAERLLDFIGEGRR